MLIAALTVTGAAAVLFLAALVVFGLAIATALEPNYDDDDDDAAS